MAMGAEYRSKVQPFAVNGYVYMSKKFPVERKPHTTNQTKKTVDFITFFSRRNVREVCEIKMISHDT